MHAGDRARPLNHCPDGESREWVCPDRIVRYAMRRVETRLHNSLATPDAFVRRFVKALGLGEGKRVRAYLTLLAARIQGRLPGAVERLAAAMELFHHATLVHDDIIDHARWRRHQPTLNHRFGNSEAVLVGDFMFTRVMDMLIHDMPQPVQTVVAHAVSRVCLGEIQELRLRELKRATVRDYETMVANKTASLFVACCEGGACLSRAPQKVAKPLAAYGHAVGMAFQIRDDVLDIIGEAQRLGKPAGADVRENRLTLPWLLAGKQRLALADGQKIPGTAQLRIRRLLQQCGALDAAQARIEHYTQRAIQALKGIPESQAKQGLVQLAGWAAEREC